jgi:hypothetical protein
MDVAGSVSENNDVSAGTRAPACKMSGMQRIKLVTPLVLFYNASATFWGSCIWAVSEIGLANALVGLLLLAFQDGRSQGTTIGCAGAIAEKMLRFHRQNLDRRDLQRVADAYATTAQEKGRQNTDTQ